MALPWDEVAKGSPDILQLLARGLTDPQITAELHVWVRTVSRRVTETMSAAGVNSRFQLGMRFVQAQRAVRRD